MSRLVKKTAQGPEKVGDKFICMCGLSRKQPFCDGSHKQTLDEDPQKLYWYGEDQKREEIVTEADDCCGCEECHCQESKKS